MLKTTNIYRLIVIIVEGFWFNKAMLNTPVVEETQKQTSAECPLLRFFEVCFSPLGFSKKVEAFDTCPGALNTLFIVLNKNYCI